MLGRKDGRHRIILAADKAYETADVVAALRDIEVTPHGGQNTANRRSTKDGRIPPITLSTTRKFSSMVIPTHISARRDKPRHLTVLPGSGSWARAGISLISAPFISAAIVSLAIARQPSTQVLTRKWVRNSWAMQKSA
jgi:hypothetical protein